MAILDWLKALFNKAIQAFRKFLDEALPLAYQVVMGQLKDVAFYAVVELSQTSLSNEAKRKEAFKKIKEYAIAHGIEARDSLINALIELAVLKLKTNE
jgi:hypothetical protein